MARRTRADLFEAVEENNFAEVKKCIEAGVDINALDDWELSPLQRAVNNDCLEIVKYLVEHGAELYVYDRNGRTPAGVAEYNGYADILDFLEKVERMRNTPEWSLFGSESVAHTVVSTDIGRQLTEIFNFASRERTVTTENMNLKVETTLPPTRFDDLPQTLIENALAQFKKLGGVADEDFVLNNTTQLHKAKNPSLV